MSLITEHQKDESKCFIMLRYFMKKEIGGEENHKEYQYDLAKIKKSDYDEILE